MVISEGDLVQHHKRLMTFTGTYMQNKYSIIIVVLCAGKRTWNTDYNMYLCKHKLWLIQKNEKEQ